MLKLLSKILKVNSNLYHLIPIFLISVWPVLNFLNNNFFEELNLKLILIYFAGFYSIILFSFYIITIISSSAKFVTIFFYVSLVHFFILPEIRELLGNEIRLRYVIIMVITSTLIISIFINKVLPSKALIPAAFYLGVILSTPPMILLGFKVNFEQSNNENVLEILGDSIVTEGMEKPNIYFILLDGYGRGEQLQNYFGFNNSIFLKYLKDRDFSILHESYSGYPNTAFSIVSLLNMEYHKEFNLADYNRRFNSPVFKVFHKFGYRTHVALGYRGGICPPKPSVCLSSGKEGVGLIGILGQRLLQLTPLFEIILKYFPQLYGDARSTVSDLKVILEITDLPSPSFVFSHISFPHPPYTRTETCRVDIREDVSNEENYAPEFAKRYLKQLRCVNKEMRGLIDLLLKKDPNSIIIIQSDHGSGFVYVQSQGNTKFDFSGSESWRNDAFLDRFGVINAWRVPQACKSNLNSTMGTVNTFRYLFTCLGFLNFGLLKNRSYWADFVEKKFHLIQTDGILND